MKSEQYLQEINSILARFVIEIKHEVEAGRTNLNKRSESIIAPLLNIIYGWNLSNINQISGNNSYPGIDLADPNERVAVQVTSTNNLDKIKHTLDEFMKNKLYESYDRLIVYILTEKQKSYSQKPCDKITQGYIKFCTEKDIWDSKSIFGDLSDLAIDRIQAVLNLLQNEFSPDNTNTQDFTPYRYIPILDERLLERPEEFQQIKELLTDKQRLQINSHTRRLDYMGWVELVNLPLLLRLCTIEKSKNIFQMAFSGYH